MNEFKEKLISINKVSKTVKGGRVFSFTAITVIGDCNGTFGYGYGKSKEVPIAIKKSVEIAKKKLLKFNISNNTILCESRSKYLCSKVFIKPAYEGTGIIANKVMRAIFEVIGVKNVLSKVYGSTNIINVIKATIKAFKYIDLINYINKNKYINFKKC